MNREERKFWFEIINALRGTKLCNLARKKGRRYGREDLSLDRSTRSSVEKLFRSRFQLQKVIFELPVKVSEIAISVNTTGVFRVFIIPMACLTFVEILKLKR